MTTTFFLIVSAIYISHDMPPALRTVLGYVFLVVGLATLFF
jgi:hypothetical protein